MEFPKQKLQMRLRINDVFSFEKEATESIFRVQKLSGNSIITAPLNEANVATRNDAKTFNYSYFSPLTLQKGNAKKLYISPTGVIGGGSKDDRKSTGS